MRQYERPDESNQQSTRNQSYTWLDAILLLFKSPGLKTFTLILKDRTLNPQRAYFQVLIGSVFLGVALASTFNPTEIMQAMLFALPDPSGSLTTPPDILSIAVSGGVSGAIYGVIGFIIQTYMFYRMGALLNWGVNYRDLVVLRAIYYPLILMVRAMILVIPGLSPFTVNALMIASLFLDVVLTATAIRAAGAQMNRA